MTWADYLNDGRGKVGYRLRIEGLQYEFVTASGMEAGESVLLLAEGGGLILDSDGGITLTELADGVSRVACLSHDGIGWKERADIVGGRLEVDGFTVRIVDRQIDQVVTRALAWQPTTLNWVDADIAVAATDAITTVSVLSSADFAVGDFVHIGTECMEVTDVPSGTSVDLRRGQRNTIPQAHSVGVGENLAYPVMAKDRPLSIEGRRANLYAYGSGDDLTGSGTLVFRGVCATDAKLDANGADWRITIDSITRMMDAPISGDIAEQVGSRGIFYNWTAPLVIDAYEISGPAVVERLRVVVPSADYPQAFFETQQDLTDYLNSAIQAESGGFATWEIANLRAVSEGADDWFLEMTMGATVARQSVATAGSVIDGYLQDYYDSTGTVFPAIVVGTTAGALTALETYQIRAAAGSRNSVEGVPNSVVRRVPRAFWGRADEAGWRRADVTEIVAPSSAPMTRIYVGGSGSLFGITAVRMEWPNGEEAFYVVSAVDETDRWIEVNNGLPIAPPGSSGYGFGNDVKIRLIRSLGRGSLEVVRNTVANASPFLANEGGLPFMTTEELASWTTEVERAARGKAWATDRVYYADEEMSFADYLAEECKAIGVFPVINDDGKIAVKRMRAPASTEPTAEEVDGTEVAIDLGRPSWERNAWGRYNQVAYSWSYDPAEQEHRKTVVARDVTAFSESKVGNSISAEPRSEPIDQFPTLSELVGLAWPYLGTFGRAYALVTFEAAGHVFFRATLGDAITITLPNIPNQFTGQRGLTEATGLLVMREFLADGGRSRLGVIVNGDLLAGYAPTLRITNITPLGGDLYQLDISDLGPFQSFPLQDPGDDVADHWEVGDLVRLSESNTTNLSVNATITAVTETAITIDTGGAFVPAAQDLIHYAAAFAADASMEVYAYQATDGARLGFAGGDEPAKRYAP